MTSEKGKFIIVRDGFKFYRKAVYVRIQSVGSPAKLRSDVKRQKAHVDNAIMKFKIHQDRFKFVKTVSYRFSTVKK